MISVEIQGGLFKPEEYAGEVEQNWRPPAVFPRIDSSEKILGIDVETYDPDLKEKGPGVRRNGYIVGISVATTEKAWYFPLEHERQFDPHGLNLPRELVFRWFNDQVAGHPARKVGANLLYDLDYLASAGITVRGPFDDVQIAEPLLDEYARNYSLDRLGKKWAGEGKESSALYEWCAAAFGGKADGSQRANIYRAPPDLVGSYAESDARVPILVLRHQLQRIKSEGLEKVYDLETRLVPLLLAMRRRGVKADIPGAEKLGEEIRRRLKNTRKDLGGIDPGERAALIAFCDKNGITYPSTAAGNPSFTADWLKRQEDPRLRAIVEYRTLEKMLTTFVDGAILGWHVDGRIHTEFNALRSDEFGTVSGRFSSSRPNLQNIPARDKEWGPRIRSLFLPDPGEDWASDDWSQIEFRLLMHYAPGKVADKIRSAYKTDPATDFHTYVSELTGIDRKPAKNINFGLVYGMGEPTMAANLGRPLEEVRPLFDEYHATLPFVKDMYTRFQKKAESRGFIHTLYGRRARFNLWESRDFGTSRTDGAMPKEEATARYGNAIRRAGGNVALNRGLQGGAADIMKAAMVDIWEAGICDTLGAPLLTVHDELNWSRPRSEAALEAHAEACQIMENCVELRLPLRVETGVGKNWAEAK